MTATFSQLLNFITSHDLAPIPYAGRTYAGHCARVYIRMRSWGCSDDLSNAAFCQAIYGTQLFQRQMLPLNRRRELKALIGLYSERLVYINCMMDRSCFYSKIQDKQDSYHIKYRLDDEILIVNQAEYNDIALMNLADFFEENALQQGWQGRAEIFHQITDRLGSDKIGATSELFSDILTEPEHGAQIEDYAAAANA